MSEKKLKGGPIVNIFKNDGSSDDVIRDAKMFTRDANSYLVHTGKTVINIFILKCQSFIFLLSKATVLRIVSILPVFYFGGLLLLLIEERYEQSEVPKVRFLASKDSFKSSFSSSSSFFFFKFWNLFCRKLKCSQLSFQRCIIY